MALPNIFTEQVAGDVINRINALKAETLPQWGKMSAPQMLAHCNVSYEMVYENIHSKPNAIVKLILKLFVKNKVVTEVPYPRSSPTAPAFIIKTDKDFNIEKGRLIAYIKQTKQLGETEFDGKISHSFGPLSVTEWNNMFYKYLNHHLTQFGC